MVRTRESKTGWETRKLYTNFLTGGIGVSGIIAGGKHRAKMVCSAAFIAALALGHNAPTSGVPTPLLVQGIIGGPAVAAMLPDLSR